LKEIRIAGGRSWKFGLPLCLALAACGAAYGFGQEDHAAAGPPEFSLTSTVAPASGVGISHSQRIDYARIDERLSALSQQKDMVGLAVAIVENGQIRFVKGYGVTQTGTDDPVTPATVFRWASLSKGVAGTLVADLAREGKLSLDTPVSQFRTSLRLPGGSEDRVTVRDVLSQRTGVVRNAYDEKLEEGQDPKLIRGSLAMLPAFCGPGQCYTYQNVAFDTASEIVQRVTGRPYGDVVRDTLFLPLGMNRASVGRAGLETAPSWARPHRNRAQMLQTKDAYYRVPAAGGVNSSIFDLAKWMRAQMGGATGVLPQSLLDQIHAPLVATPPHGPRGEADRALNAQFYGMGWRDFAYAGHRQVGHRGAVDGYRSLILFDPVEKTGIAMLWNSHSIKPVGIQLELLDMLYGLPRHDWITFDDAAPPVIARATPAQKTPAQPGGARATGR
jgi:beta-lactamase class C